ncbi:MAG: polysaccharide biosynthesis tyrosine autokinase [Methylophilaceae bacterium]
MAQSTSPIPNISMNQSSEFKIGILLIKSGKITSNDARQIVALSNTKSMRFGDAAIELGFVTEADIDEVIAKQFDYTYLPYSNEFSPHLISAFHPNSPEAEFIRGLRTQLSLGWFKDENKAISISSIDSGSGNSRFVANLAVAFSQLGKKTLLIDANLRNPTQQLIFNHSSQQRGLSDMLIGRAGLEAIYNIVAINKLSFLPTGAIPPNPQELVSGSVFKDLITFLHEIFDVILIDTPAFSVGADAQAIAAAIGGVLLVARKDVTRASKISATAKMLASNGTQVVGSVMTDF